MIRAPNPLNIMWPLLYLTFGGMWRWRRVAVARVFALVVRCRDMMLFCLFSRWQKPWHQWGSPAGAGAGRTADHLAVLFSQKILAVRSANDIYRPVVHSCIKKNTFNYQTMNWHISTTGLLRIQLQNDDMKQYSSPYLQPIMHIRPCLMSWSPSDM